MKTITIIITITVCFLSGCNKGHNTDSNQETSSSTINESVEYQNIDSIDSEVKDALLSFINAVIRKDCNSVTEYFIFPLQDDCGGWMPIKENETTEIISSDSQLTISRNEIIQNCIFFDDKELGVIQKLISDKTNKGVKYDDCEYGWSINLDDYPNEFSWSIGCNNLINEEIGEYSKIFFFKLVDGKYRIYRLACAG